MAEKTLTRPSLKKQAPVASKSTMNLAFHESNFRLSRVLPVILVVVIIAALFAKFGFIDMISKKTAAYAELGQKQEQMQSISAKLAEYDELAAEYGRYSYGWLTEDEAALVDRMAVLTIIEKTIDADATVQDLAINKNVLIVNISGITLENTSALVNKLEDDPLVKSVSVYTAVADDETMEAQVSMTIILEKEAEVNE